MNQPSGSAPSTTCAACGRDVPTGAFCASCGADLTTDSGDGRGRLRLAAYAAAPREHVLRLRPTSSMFPHLSRRSRRPFGIALLLLVVVLVALPVAGLQAPLIGAGVLGIPLLFALYLRQSGVAGDLPRSSVAVGTGLGVALGVGWGLVGGRIVSGESDVALGHGLTMERVLLIGLTIPLAGALLMLVPVVAVRMLTPNPRESLDGFAIGAWGAVVFTGATTLTRLAPQLATGPFTDGRPLSPTLVEAGIRGLAMPVIAASVGGIVGLGLWFSKPGNASRAHRGVDPGRAAVAMVVTVAIYATLGLVEILRTPDDVQLVLHLVIAGATLLVLRTAVQAALLHEDRGPRAEQGPVLCAHCDHVVPAAAFCPSCGVATHAAARSDRAARRVGVVEQESADAASRPGYGLPTGTYQVGPARHSRYRDVLPALAIGLTTAGVAAFVVSMKVTPAAPRYICPPDCGRPPMGVPVAVNPRFTSSGGEFSVSYPAPGAAYRADTDPNGIVLDYTAGDTGTMELFGQPALGRSAREITEQLLKRSYPDGIVEYEIPNAAVGYQPGYGVAADVFPSDPDSTFTRLRVLILVAVKNDYALVASAVGPYRRFTPDFGSGHPSGANLELALDMGKYVNSFMWRGDPPR